MWCLVLLLVRRPAYCSLLLLVVVGLTTAYTVEEICNRRCLYHRGGVLCNCNARHFTGKRSGLAAASDMYSASGLAADSDMYSASGLAADAGMYSAESARPGLLSQFSLGNIGNDNPLVPERVRTLGHRHLISHDLQQKIREFWGQRRLGDILEGQGQRSSYTIDTDGENADDDENSASSPAHDNRPEIVVHSSVSDHVTDDEQMTPVMSDPATAVDGRDDAGHARVAVEQYIRQLEAALRRAWHGRRRHGLV